MYSSEKNPGFNWKDLVIKVVFVFLFIILLMWLFKKSTPNMTPFYSNVFRENVKYMQDAAESYYTNERLPKNIGDSAEITLAEMIRKNMILPFVDKDGNECDTNASYVQVVKNKNDYTLRVNLVCPTEKNFVEKTLGCYDYCEDCTEEEKALKEIEYQFKKATSSTKNVYSCPNGGTLKNGICYVYGSESYKATEKSTSGEYYCPNGGYLSGNLCYVSKENSYKAYSNSSSGYYTCPNGGELVGSRCYVTSSGSSYDAKIINYTCPNGGYLSGTMCIKSSGSNYPATPNTSKGDSYAATPKTDKVRTVIGNATPKTGKSYLNGTYTKKPSGYTCSTSKQYICSSSSNCPGYVTVYTGCYKKATTYSCSSGTLEGTQCVRYTNKTTYSCPRGGSLSGTTCYLNNGKTTYSCPRGGSLSGTMCVFNSSSYYATPDYSCPNGGNLLGSKCYFNGNTTSYNASYISGASTKYCDNGDKLVGDRCYYTKNESYLANKTEGKKSYECTKGGTFNSNNKTCSVSVLKSQYNATKTTKTSNGYIYKWSTSETLEGWARTGATREVEKKK